MSMKIKLKRITFILVSIAALLHAVPAYARTSANIEEENESRKDEPGMEEEEAGFPEAISGSVSLARMIERIEFRADLLPERDALQEEPGTKITGDRAGNGQAKEEGAADEAEEAEEEERREEARAAAEAAQAAAHAAAREVSLRGQKRASGSLCGSVGVYGYYSDLSYPAAQKAVASRIYSVLKAVGWPDEMIAGALGNIETECGFDFTAVEWISYHCSESFAWGPDKQAWDDADYIMAVLKPDYPFEKVYRAGIGIIGWTDTTDGAAGNTGLRAYAAKHGTVWYDLELQLAYLTDRTNGDGSCADKILNWKIYDGCPKNTPSECAYWWAKYIEGCTYDLDLRQSRAEKWYRGLSSLTYDEAYAEMIFAMASVE